MKLASKKNWARVLIAAGCALTGYLGGEGQAAALGAHFGGEAGIGTRSHQGFGPVIGAHLELNIIEGLYVGGYINDMLVYPDNQPDNIEKRASFVALGGRIRYAITVAPKLRPYLAVGLGYVYAEYPGFAFQPGTVAGQQNSTTIGRISAYDGHFVELPVQLGLAWEWFSHSQLDLGLAWRPGFAFGGDAYDSKLGNLPKPTQGFTATLGLNFFF